MKREFELATRRDFFRQSAATLAVLNAIAAQRANAGPQATTNPFAYDVSHYEMVDPKLISHEEITRFKSPYPQARRIAIGPADTLYVCSGNYVTGFNTAGERTSEIACAEPPHCVAPAADGTVFVGLRTHIEVFDAKGTRQATWESPGKKSWITGLAVSHADLFAADAGGRVILRYDRSGQVTARIGEKNSSRNVPGFIVPSPFLDVHLAADGLLRVNNPGRHRVELYTVDGDFEGSWGAISMGIAGFCGCCNPINLALLPDGRYVTCEKGLPRVKIYSAKGEFETVVAGPDAFTENAKACGPSDCTAGGLDAAVDSQGRIHILDLVTGSIRIMKHKA